MQYIASRMLIPVKGNRAGCRARVPEVLKLSALPAAELPAKPVRPR